MASHLKSTHLRFASTSVVLPRLLICLTGIVLVSFTLAIVNTAWLSDDAFISFRSIVNFISGDGITWNAGQRIQAFTHPAWFFLLSGLYAITNEVYYTTIVASVALTISALAILALISHRSGSLPTLLFGATLLLLSNAFIDYSTSGLENPLSYFLLACVMYMTLCQVTESRKSLTIIYLLMAVAFLNRMDYALLLLPLALTLLWHHRRNAWPGIGFAFSLVIVWFGFATLYFGAPLPTPFYAKLTSGLPTLEYLQRGLNYYQVQWLKDPITLIIIAGGLVFGWRSNPCARALCLGLILYQFYVLRIGGDFMQGRFFAVPAFIATGLIGLHSLSPRWAVFLFLAVFGTHLAQSPLVKTKQYHNKEFVKNIADERGFYFQHYGLMSDRRRWPKIVNRAADDYSEVIYRCGGSGRRSLMMPKNIYVIDYCGLADPLLARTPPKHLPHWRVGHLRRKIPTNYGKSLLSQDNLLTDPALMPLFDDLQLISRGELFSKARFSAIKRLNLGDYPEIDFEAYTNPKSELPESVRVRRVPLDRLTARKTRQGLAWNASGNVKFKKILDVISEKQELTDSLQLALGHNDTYRVSLFKKNVVNFEIVLKKPSKSKTRSGLLHYQVSSKLNNGKPFAFDKIRIEAIKGDEQYSVGHILIN